MERTYTANHRAVGLILIAIGLFALFGGVIGMLSWAIGRFLWPVAMLLIGAAGAEKQYRYYQQTGRLQFPWPLFPLFWGISGLLKTIGLGALGISAWPLFLVAMGLWMLRGRH